MGGGWAARHDYHVLSTAMWNAYPERLISDNGLPMEVNFYNQDIYILFKQIVLVTESASSAFCSLIFLSRMHIVIKRPFVRGTEINKFCGIEYTVVKSLFLVISPSDTSKIRRQKVQLLWKVPQNKHWPQLQKI
jgi:transcription elongation factor GreA-like protein